MENIDLNKLRRELIKIREWAQNYIDKLQPPPATEAGSLPINPPPPAAAQVIAGASPRAADAASAKEVDKKLPMLVWKKTLKGGYTPEFWPHGEVVIGGQSNSYVKAYNVSNLHYGLSISMLTIHYPLPDEFHQKPIGEKAS